MVGPPILMEHPTIQPRASIVKPSQSFLNQTGGRTFDISEAGECLKDDQQGVINSKESKRFLII